MKYVSSKSDKTIEVEEDFDPKTGKDLAREEAISKGWKPVHTVVSTKSNKTIDVEEDALDEAFSKGWQLPQVAEAKAKPAGISPVESAARGWLNMFGQADKMAGLEGMLRGEDYTNARDERRMVDKYAEQENPNASQLGSGIGGLMTGGVIPGGTLAKSMIQGGIQGGAASDGETANEVAGDVVAGSTIGGALYGAGASLSTVYDNLRQGAIKAGKWTASKFGDVAPEQIQRYLDRAPEVNAARDAKKIAVDLYKGGGELAKKVSKSSGDSYKALDEADVSVPKAQIARMLDEKMLAYKQGGSFTPEAEKDARVLDKLKKALDSVEGDILSGPQAKNLLRQYDGLANPKNGSPSTITPILQRDIGSVRGEVSDNLKGAVPAYEKVMETTKNLTQTLKNTQPLVKDKKTALRNVKTIVRDTDETGSFVRDDIRALDEANGTNLVDEIDDLAVKKTLQRPNFNGSRNVNAGNSVGGSFGAILGYAKDTVAKPVTKKALDLALIIDKSALSSSLKDTLVKAAQKGPAQFLLTHELLMKSNEEYRKATGN